MAEGDNNVQQRYCGNCGIRLSPQDRFCSNCGTPVHRSARVPTPEADKPIPPPPPQQSREAGARSVIRRPRQTLAGILLLLGVVETALGMPAPTPDRSFAFRIGIGIGGAIFTVLGVAAIGLVVGGLVYLLSSLRRSDTDFVESIFSWPVVVGLLTFLQVI